MILMFYKIFMFQNRLGTKLSTQVLVHVDTFLYNIFTLIKRCVNLYFLYCYHGQFDNSIHYTLHNIIIFFSMQFIHTVT